MSRLDRYRNLAEHYTGDLRDVAAAVEQREPDAVARLTLLATQGDAEAAELLANLFVDGFMVYPDRDRARAWFRRAAELGRPDSMVNYALFRRGEVTRTQSATDDDAAEVFGWLHRAAEAGNTRALTGLGAYRAEFGETPEERAAGVSMLHQAAASQHGRAHSQLAQCYLEGNCVEVDLEAAYMHLLIAHELGYSRCDVTGEWLRSQLSNAQAASAHRSAAEWLPVVR